MNTNSSFGIVKVSILFMWIELLLVFFAPRAEIGPESAI